MNYNDVKGQYRRRLIAVLSQSCDFSFAEGGESDPHAFIVQNIKLGLIRPEDSPSLAVPWGEGVALREIAQSKHPDIAVIAWSADGDVRVIDALGQAIETQICLDIRSEWHALTYEHQSIAGKIGECVTRCLKIHTGDPKDYTEQMAHIKQYLGAMDAIRELVKRGVLTLPVTPSQLCVGGL